MASIVYAGFVERGGIGYGLYFPDLPGCVTAATDMTELAANAREALGLHLEALVESGELLPAATPAENLREEDPEIDVVGLMLVDADLADAAVRVNVSLPSSLLKRIDRAATTRGFTRSAFLAEGARGLLKAG